MSVPFTLREEFGVVVVTVRESTTLDAMNYFPTQPVLVLVPDSFTNSVVVEPPLLFKYKSPGLPVTTPCGEPAPVESCAPLKNKLPTPNVPVWVYAPLPFKVIE